MNNKIIQLLITGAALGTGWAVRGKFGHEQGAAWAGALGALALVIQANREDWNNRILRIMLAAAFGWGVGGMISYGVVIGYGKSSDFLNAFYGLDMLFIIGALYGFLGGGFVGLAFSDDGDNKVRWETLLVEMTAWALITYGFLINQLEWFMTPPRSELWAACFGMSIGLAWFMIRYQYYSACKVAGFSALGAGFGFAFGDFLQAIGQEHELGLNLWNVMEYSIGFFGGAGMCYGTITSPWPVTNTTQSKKSNILPFLLLFIFIPFVIWEQSFTQERILGIADKITSNTAIVYQITVALLLIAMIGTFYLHLFFNKKKAKLHFKKSALINLFLIYGGTYTLLSFIITGVPVFRHLIEQYLYLINFVLILFGFSKPDLIFEDKKLSPKGWLYLLLTTLFILALLAAVAINLHGELPGSKNRF